MESKKVPVHEDREVRVARRLGISVGKARLLLERIDAEERTVAVEPNGSRTDRSTRDALAELGARVLEILRTGHARRPFRASVEAESVWYGEILTAARSLGLLGEEAKP